MAYEHVPYDFLADPDRFRIGGADDEVIVRTAEESRNASLSLVQQARRYIWIFSHQLDAELFDNDEFVDAVSKFILRSPSTQLHILVKNPRDAVQRRHRMIDLCQRLTSYIHVRRVADEFQKAIDAFVVVDRIGFLYRKRGDRYDGLVNFNGRVKADRLQELFQTIWEQSEPDPEFRILNI